MDCIFCKIIAGEIPSNLLYQDQDVIAFNDINPAAPQHKLIVPRRHIATINDLTLADAPLIGHMVLVAKKIAAENEMAESGYRLVLNCNSDGGQAVYHIHLHLLGGRAMHWPPG
jgi:histidine triad (HIT) family protein